MPRSKKELKHPHIHLEMDDLHLLTDERRETYLEIVASSVIKLADGIRKINDSGLTQRAIVLLLHDATGVNKKEIVKILEAAPLLAERYVRLDEVED